MEEIITNFEFSPNKSSIIKVIGVGGGGGNAVNHMYRMGINGVDFVIVNTDLKALQNSPVPIKIQIGSTLTEGRGAGNKAEIGKQAAIENINEINKILSDNTKMVFITACMGGGTGTGAAPIIAKVAREKGILTVAIVTIPFRSEGQKRINQAIDGISELEKYVDSLLVINNEKIREIYGDLKLSIAFAKADDILATAVKSIAEIITVHGYINVDFADVETVMRNSGVAIMGSAKASGENRAIKAVKEALSSPLLNDNDIKGAKNILINITTGKEEVTIDEIGQITDYIQECSGSDADLIWGNAYNENLNDEISVTIIATGFTTNSIPDLYIKRKHLDKVQLIDESLLENNLENVNEISFEIKTNDKLNPKNEIIQKRSNEVEFIIKNASDNHNNMNDNDIFKSNERLKTIRRTQEYLKDLIFNTNDVSLIEKLENEPAYIRKKINIKLNNISNDGKLSKVSLKEDESIKKPKLSKNNPFLNKKDLD